MTQMHGREELVGQITVEEWKTGQRAGRRFLLLATKSKEVAERISEMYQGEVVCAASGSDLYIRKLHAEGIAVIVASVANVRPRLALENERGLVHACNGSRYLPPTLDEGASCGCPVKPFERRAAALSGVGPRPDARLVFCLAAAPGLGEFSFRSSAWQFHESLESVSRNVERTAGPVQMELVLREQRLVTRSGLDVSFMYPEVRHLSVTKGGLHLAA